MGARGSSRPLPRAGGPEATLADMTDFLGRQVAPPSWAFDGALLGVQGGIGELRRKAEAVLSSGAKVAAICAHDWCGVRGAGRGIARDWTWDRERYPELPKAIAAWRSRGLRFLGYVNPLLAAAGELYADASRKGFCVKSADRRDYLLGTATVPTAMVDLTNPAAFAWMKETIKRELLGIGMAGWLADAGEILPLDAVVASGEEPALAHNRWPQLWAKANREAIEESGLLGEVLFFSRSGWLGSTRYATAFWAGDQAASFSRKEGLPSAVPAGLSLGLSGVGFWHSEIGGSVTRGWKRRSAECLGRWMEMAAFSPFFRCGEGSKPEGNAQPWSDAASLSLFARMSEVFAALKPYHLQAAAEYAERGLPPIRHLWMHYEDDAEARRLDYQYLYGRDLMVAPALAEGAALTSLYLPEDEWVHLWSSRVFRGGRVTVESPLGCPAVFYRAESRFASLFDALRRTARRV